MSAKSSVAAASASLVDFLRACRKVHDNGLAVPETSYYPAIDRLLSAVGGTMNPKVYAITHVSGRGGAGTVNSGIPDLGLFVDTEATKVLERDLEIGERLPERGVVEVKPPSEPLDKVVSSAQVRKYLDRYGKVLLTNLREWRLVDRAVAGKKPTVTTLVLAPNEAAFWALAAKPESMSPETLAESAEFLVEALAGEGTISRVDDVARILGAQARRALSRIEKSNFDALEDLRASLEDGLGMQFRGESGERFFRSTLVQSLFYGVFSAWVLAKRPGGSHKEFEWTSSQWHLTVPIVQALFQQIADPTHLKPLGLDLILDGTQATLRRVDTERFFAEFDERYAVQHFYEPFIGYFDPQLRKNYGVWYTPPEVVDYMVEHVDQALRTRLGRPNGLADDNVWVLDPCVGTGSFLLAVAQKIHKTLPKDALASQDLKNAVLTRLVGFELLPAPFVVAHLQLGLFLDEVNAPLEEGERVPVYLTNSLTGWMSHEATSLPLKAFEAERDAADQIKTNAPILVVLGNPPYNGYAGVDTSEESELIAPYRVGIDTRNSLGDLYVRFFRIAERQIAERSGEGLVCYISNFSYLHEPGFATMRSHLRDSFDEIYIDNLNGDSRETGKKTPDGNPDPSIFSTRFNRDGIQTGTAIGLFVRHQKGEGESEPAAVHYREFWGVGKHARLAEMTNRGESGSTLQGFEPVKFAALNRHSFRPAVFASDYESWPSIASLAKVIELGVNENRGNALIEIDEQSIRDRMTAYFDAGAKIADLSSTAAAPLVKPFARYDPERTRNALLPGGLQEANLRRIVASPMDYHWAYVEPSHKLWNEGRPELVRHLPKDSAVLLLRNRAPRLKDGIPILPASAIANQHALHKDAYHVPIRIRTDTSRAGGMFADDTEPNLSSTARQYLEGIGVRPGDSDYDTILWHHIVAVTSSPRYEEQNSGGIAADWPRIPLPADSILLRESAALGNKVWSLLDPVRTPLAQLPSLGMIHSTRPTGKVSPGSGDLEIHAEWSRVQPTKHGFAVMPGNGKTETRKATPEEKAIWDADNVVDVYLNEHTYWAAIPQQVWDLKIGGFQVLKKWLAYREHGPTGTNQLLGRALTPGEVRRFTDLAQRLAAFVSLGELLDRNYERARSSHSAAPTMDHLPE